MKVIGRFGKWNVIEDDEVSDIRLPHEFVESLVSDNKIVINKEQ